MTAQPSTSKVYSLQLRGICRQHLDQLRAGHPKSHPALELVEWLVRHKEGSLPPVEDAEEFLVNLTLLGEKPEAEIDRAFLENPRAAAEGELPIDLPALRAASPESAAVELAEHLDALWRESLAYSSLRARHQDREQPIDQ